MISGLAFLLEGGSLLNSLPTQMMGKKALEAAEYLVDSLKLGGKLTPQEFLAKREAALDAMFPSAELLPGNNRSSWAFLRFVFSKTANPMPCPRTVSAA